MLAIPTTEWLQWPLQFFPFGWNTNLNTYLLFKKSYVNVEFGVIKKNSMYSIWLWNVQSYFKGYFSQ